MRKKMLSMILCLAFLVSFSSVAQAQNPFRKLGRGVVNVVTSPFEILTQIAEVSEEEGAMTGFSWGLLKGCFNTVGRAVVGVYEIATFPFPIPAGYEPIIDEPEIYTSEFK